MVDARSSIGQLQARRDIQGLIASLSHTDPDIRKRAAVALRIMDVAQAVPALKLALRTEKDPQTQAVLSAALYNLVQRTDVHQLVQSKDINGLIRVLKSRHPEQVIEAAQALGDLGDRLAVEPLVILFQNASSPPRVRLAAAEALLALKSAPAVVTLLGALRRDSWPVRRNAAAVLGQLQATWAVEPLAHTLHDPEPIVRRTAAAALRRIGTVEALSALHAYVANRTVEPAPRVRSVEPSPAPLPEPAPKSTSSGDSAPIVPELPLAPVALEAQDSLMHPDPVEDERPSRITRPVMKLIAFLKRGGDHS